MPPRKASRKAPQGKAEKSKRRRRQGTEQSEETTGHRTALSTEIEIKEESGDEGRQLADLAPKVPTEDSTNTNSKRRRGRKPKGSQTAVMVDDTAEARMHTRDFMYRLSAKRPFVIEPFDEVILYNYIRGIRQEIVKVIDAAGTRIADQDMRTEVVRLYGWMIQEKTNFLPPNDLNDLFDEAHLELYRDPGAQGQHGEQRVAAIRRFFQDPRPLVINLRRRLETLDSDVYLFAELRRQPRQIASMLRVAESRQRSIRDAPRQYLAQKILEDSSNAPPPSKHSVASVRNDGKQRARSASPETMPSYAYATMISEDGLGHATMDIQVAAKSATPEPRDLYTPLWAEHRFHRFKSRCRKMGIESDEYPEILRLINQVQSWEKPEDHPVFARVDTLLRVFNTWANILLPYYKNESASHYREAIELDMSMGGPWLTWDTKHDAELAAIMEEIREADDAPSWLEDVMLPPPLPSAYALLAAWAIDPRTDVSRSKFVWTSELGKKVRNCGFRQFYEPESNDFPDLDFWNDIDLHEARDWPAQPVKGSSRAARTATTTALSKEAWEKLRFSKISNGHTKEVIEAMRSWIRDSDWEEGIGPANSDDAPLVIHFHGLLDDGVDVPASVADAVRLLRRNMQFTRRDKYLLTANGWDPDHVHLPKSSHQRYFIKKMADEAKHDCLVDYLANKDRDSSVETSPSMYKETGILEPSETAASADARTKRRFPEVEDEQSGDEGRAAKRPSFILGLLGRNRGMPQS